MNIAEIESRLSEGNQRFINDKLEGKLSNSNRRSTLVDGQNPFAIVLGCADSRVVPELIFDTGLGELFTIRVAGNVSNTSSIASIEYAVSNMGCKVIVVLGHQNCGAVTAAIKGGDNGYNLNYLLTHITPAIAANNALASVDEVVRTNAELNALNLINKSTIIREAINKRDLKIMPAFYHLSSGEVEYL